jgi:hypothetical protein
MPITSVGGFFGRRTRQRKPAGVDVIFATDLSGSMGPLVDFIDQTATAVALEAALLAENVGILVPNRYCKSSMQNMSVAAGIPWQFGSDILATPSIWENWTTTGFRWGSSQEDVTGSAFRIANTGFPYGYDTSNNPASNGSVFGPTYPDRAFRGNASQILIASSDEQSGQPMYFTNDVYARITNPQTLLRYVGVSNIRIDAPIGGLDGLPFGIVFTSANTWKLIVRPFVGTDPIFLDVDRNNVAFYTDGNNLITDTSASGATLINAGGEQLVNTPKLARGTSGAIYDINQFFGSNGPEVFGKSLGLVLGRFLYSLE